MKNYFRSGFVIALTTFALYACTDDYFELDKIKTDEWRPEIAVPAVNSSLTLEDILIKKDSNNLIQTGPNGVLEVIYNGSVFSAIGGQFIDLPNQNFSEVVNLPAGQVPPSPIPAGTPNIQFNQNIDITYTTAVEIDSVLLKGGQLIFTMQNEFRHNLIARISFPSIKDANGNLLVINQSLPASNGVVPTVRSEVTDLNGYKLDMTQGSAQFNNLRANVDLTIQPVTGNPISANDKFEVIGEFRGVAFKEFNGYIGQQNLQLEKDTIPINMFKNFKKGIFFISNPTMEIDIVNSYGVPAYLNFQDLKALNPDNPSPTKVINLPTDPVTNTSNLRSLQYPTGRGTAITELNLNNTNGNIADIISYLLKEIVYESEVQFNPQGPLSNRNFFSDTSGIGLNIFLKIPFEGRASEFYLVDTIPMDLSVTSNLESGTIRTIADNGFPVDVKMQMVFTDSLYNRIDSLYPQGATPIIPAAPIDGNGDATGTSRQITDTGIDQDRFNKLSDGKYAIIIAELNTTDATQNKNVRFKSGYKLDIGVSIRAKVLVD